MNFTLMMDPNLLPFRLGAIHQFPLYLLAFGDKATNHEGIFTRPAVLLTRRGAYSELTIQTVDAADVSRPVVINPQSETCILCVQGTSHTLRRHEAVQELAPVGSSAQAAI